MCVITHLAIRPPVCRRLHILSSNPSYLTALFHANLKETQKTDKCSPHLSPLLLAVFLVALSFAFPFSLHSIIIVPFLANFAVLAAREEVPLPCVLFLFLSLPVPHSSSLFLCHNSHPGRSERPQVYKNVAYLGSVQSSNADGSDLEIASVIATVQYQNKLKQKVRQTKESSA